MAKKPTLTTVASGYQSTTMLNANLNAINNALDNTLSLDGSTPNNMTADIDLNSNDLLNVATTHTTNLYLGGSRVVAAGTLNTVSNMDVDEFTGDGSTVAYVLSSTPLSIDVVIVNVDGAAQLATSYTLSVATLTFSEAPPLDSAIQIRYFTDVQLGTSTSADLVSYSQGSTGHVTRTVEARLRDHVSVLDYGAVGDGTTDDTVAINAALLAAAGGTIVFPEPSVYYLVSGNLIVYSDTNVVGLGLCLFMLAYNSNADVFRSYLPQIGAARNKNIKIRNITINANAGTNGANQPPHPSYGWKPYANINAIAACRMTNVDNLLIEDCHFYNAIGYGLELKSVTDYVVQRCKFSACGDDGFSNSDGSFGSSARGRILYCTAYDNGRPYTLSGNSGFEVDDGPDDLLFSHCFAYDNFGRGFEIHIHTGKTDAIKGITYSHCSALNNNAPAGYTYRSNYGFGIDGIASTAYTARITYSHCYSTGHDNTEMDIGPSDTAGGLGTFVTIDNCTLEGVDTGTLISSEKKLIKIAGCDQVTITNNDFSYVYSSESCTGIRGYNVNKNVTITGNTSKGLSQEVYLPGDPTNGVILYSNNTATKPQGGPNAGTSSVFLYNAWSVTVSGNNIEVDSTLYESGISLNSGTTRVSATSNVVRGVPTGAIKYPSYGITVGNKVSSQNSLNTCINWWSGVYASGSSSVLVGNCCPGCTNAKWPASSTGQYVQGNLT